MLLKQVADLIWLFIFFEKKSKAPRCAVFFLPPMAAKALCGSFFTPPLSAAGGSPCLSIRRQQIQL
jgi:hypothetical protein